MSSDYTMQISEVLPGREPTVKKEVTLFGTSSDQGAIDQAQRQADKLPRTQYATVFRPGSDEALRSVQGRL